MAGLRLSGIVAPFVPDGAINRIAFETYVNKVLIQELSPGNVVIMDNLSSHKGPQVRSMIEAAGAILLYLPPYSPDLNPVENAFGKLKALLRKAATRTVSDLRSTIGQIIHIFTPAECANYFAAARYDATWKESALASAPKAFRRRLALPSVFSQLDICFLVAQSALRKSVGPISRPKWARSRTAAFLRRGT